MGNLYVRVDDRLIHGQIVTAWCVTLGIQEIIAIDDTLAGNAMMKSIMTMGIPAVYDPRIVTYEEAKELLSTPTPNNRLIVTRFCKNLLAIKEEIRGCKHINLGNCSKQPDSIYNLRGFGVGHLISLTQEDVDALEEFEQMEIPIICQLVPTEKQKTWSELKNK